MSDSLIPSFLVGDVSESLRSLTKNERCERITQVAHQKWATMSDLLRSLTKNKQPWANRSGRSPKMSEWANRSFFWANRSFAHFFAKNEWFAQKTDERIPSPENVMLITVTCSFFSELYFSIIQNWPHLTNLWVRWLTPLNYLTLFTLLPIIKFNCWRYGMDTSMWLNCLLFPSIWLKFSSHKALQ